MKKVIYIIVGLIGTFLCLVVALVVIGYWMEDPSNLRAPSDRKLIAIFHAHRVQFDKIQQMATEDAQYGWYFNSPYFEGAKLDEKYRQEYEKDPRYAWYFKSPYFEGGKLKEARQKEYEELVSEIRPDLSIGMDYNGAMGFGFARGGSFLAIGPGWSKGITYVPESHETNRSVYCGEWKMGDVTNPPQWQGLLLTNLDNARTLPADVYLRPIESNWFLSYSRDE